LTQELNRLRSLPRVRKVRNAVLRLSADVQPGLLDPAHGLGQTLHIHLEEYAPGGVSQKHGHVNEAVFYILTASAPKSTTAYATSGSRRHRDRAQQLRAPALQPQHEKPARCLVMKTKPMYLFMNMLFQRTIVPFSREPSATGVGFVRAKTLALRSSARTRTRSRSRRPRARALCDGRGRKP